MKTKLKDITEISKQTREYSNQIENMTSLSDQQKMIIDIGSKSSWPANLLSNFAKSPFTIHGIKCNSMEGFIQALKFKNPEVQIKVCQLVGLEAKKRGYNIKWWERPEREQLFWKGIGFKAHGSVHMKLIGHALYCKFGAKNNSNFQAALLATGEAKLVHSIGKEERTSLRASDFCRLLTQIRNGIRGRYVPNFK